MNYSKIFFSLLLVVFTASYCGKQNATAEQASQLKQISISEFSDLVKKDPSVKVLDVRTEMEYKEGHVPGAKLFTLNEIESQGAAVEKSLPFSKEDKIYVICKSGGRSLKATRILTSLGYTDAVNVKEGTMGFIKMGNPVEK